MHLVFSTKHRDPLIPDELREDVFAYLFGIARKLGCEPVQVGGVSDHVHILLGLSRTLTISDMVKKIKTGSTTWLKEEKGQNRFSWQIGYGIASVSARDSSDLVRYIRNQAEHHKKVDFKAEYLLFLNENGIDYDERYIWD